jgi:predicted nucleic acid-binding protein
VAEALGWLDTNIFVHAIIPGHKEYARCVQIIDALADGRAEGWITPVVLHELAYVLGRFPAYRSRAVVAAYLLDILDAPGVLAEDKPVLLATMGRWMAGVPLGFVDAYLAELAARDGLPVCSANACDFPATPNSYATAAI